VNGGRIEELVRVEFFQLLGAKTVTAGCWPGSPVDRLANVLNQTLPIRRHDDVGRNCDSICRFNV
jgi:hypothetical protein